jgi:hypothetical protein
MDKSGKCVDPEKMIDRDKKPKVVEQPKELVVDAAPRKPKGPAVKKPKPKSIPE